MPAATRHSYLTAAVLLSSALPCYATSRDPAAEPPVPSDTAPAKPVERPQLEPRPGRAALAMTGMLALGTGWYWAYRGQNAVDWDDPDLQARVSGEAWRLDNNGLAMI